MKGLESSRSSAGSSALESISLTIHGSGRSARPWAVAHSEERVVPTSMIREAVDTLFDLRSRWVKREPSGFYTLGFATYLDASLISTAEAESDRLSASNSLIRDHFGDVLHRVQHWLTEMLNADIEWATNLPLAGFHIFPAPSLSMEASAPPGHFDLQFYAGRFEGPILGLLSVTIPFCLPTAGAALDYWPIDYAGVERLRALGIINTISDVQILYPRRQVVYEPGFAYVQQGLPLHRIAPSRDISASDFRISLQCHAIQIADRWLVYW
jgi:hypothetical protein